MTSGVYFILSYTFAPAIDDGQDALVAGQPASAQNSYAPNAEKGPSVTDQRKRFVLSCVGAPKAFHRDHEWLGLFFNNWRLGRGHGGQREANKRHRNRLRQSGRQ